MEENKCIRDPFQKNKSSPNEKDRAGRQVYLAPAGVSLYIQITPSFRFISSRTWLPNEHIDYLSWMHISQLKAIKSCKISTLSRSASGSTSATKRNYICCVLLNISYKAGTQHMPTHGNVTAPFKIDIVLFPSF